MSQHNDGNLGNNVKSASGSSRAEAAPGDGRDPTAGLTSGKTAGTSSHAQSDVPAPGNTNIGKGGATSMSGTDNAHPGAQATPAGGAGGAGGAGAGMAHSGTAKDESNKQGSGNPEQDPKHAQSTEGTEDSSKNKTPEQANASGDGTFGDGKFDAAAPGAAAKAVQLEAKARTDVGEEGKINVHVP
ncbi:protein of unknown function [Taphrina deformans PYCC 5710]|uniref:Uncharacterized protein n=1 Tax=Taphrina deformans (strain PYCC 5710 / ATCC 11124 / CBS 356.35 / IMI 108563 / JCM 9778 / NBRC 8474) TaxID=1097556 RepID=R4X7T5_TAPDE|nr:protein of unknown function [Taphrina deformans PYCC 5710]|eukprot:CCG81490.1 protein of unknown function [Taphrina deformans PYCC 5710]